MTDFETGKRQSHPPDALTRHCGSGEREGPAEEDSSGALDMLPDHAAGPGLYIRGDGRGDAGGSLPGDVWCHSEGGETRIIVLLIWLCGFIFCIRLKSFKFKSKNLF